jgi:hypothetical protein
MSLLLALHGEVNQYISYYGDTETSAAEQGNRGMMGFRHRRFAFFWRRKKRIFFTYLLQNEKKHDII